jgi:hypothetical protein
MWFCTAPARMKSVSGRCRYEPRSSATGGKLSLPLDIGQAKGGVLLLFPLKRFSIFPVALFL